MGLPPPLEPFQDRRDDTFDPLEVPTFFQPDFGATMRPQNRHGRTMPVDDEVNREEQEEADAALARQLQEQELGTDIGDDDAFGLSDRRQRARRARRRVNAIAEDDIRRLDERDSESY